MAWAVGVWTTVARRTARVANTTADLGQLVNAQAVVAQCWVYEPRVVGDKAQITQGADRVSAPTRHGLGRRTGTCYGVQQNW